MESGINSQKWEMKKKIIEQALRFAENNFR